MPNLTPVTTITELPRDRWGRPLITPPDGGEPVAYTRATTFAKALDDTYHLDRWQQRMVALGMGRRRDLQLAAAAISDPDDRFQKRALQDIADRAKDSGAPSAAAIGTALHSFTEQQDKGLPLTDLPEEYAADLRAYAEIMKGFDILGVETFVVNDELRVGGTFDRVLRLREDVLLPEALLASRPDWSPVLEAGTAIVSDVKTGRSVDLGAGAFALQLGVYATSVVYNHETGSRHPLPGDPSRKVGLIIHLPAGKGTASLNWLDISGGVDAFSLAVAVREYRARRDLIAVGTTVTAGASAPAPLAHKVATAPSVEELGALYRLHTDEWTVGLTDLAKRRKAELKGDTP